MLTSHASIKIGVSTVTRTPAPGDSTYRQAFTCRSPHPARFLESHLGGGQPRLFEREPGETMQGVFSRLKSAKLSSQAPSIRRSAKVLVRALPQLPQKRQGGVEQVPRMPPPCSPIHPKSQLFPNTEMPILTFVRSQSGFQ